MEERNYGKFSIPELFDIVNTHSILQEWIVPNSGEIPYITAGDGNNGISTYISCEKEWIDEGNCIFIGGKTMTVFYEKDDFCSNDSHNLALYLKDSSHRTEYIQLFIASVIRSSLSQKYSWGNSISKKKIQNDFVSLPLIPNTTDQIDWQYMHDYIRELEDNRIKELDVYLKATGLNDYELTAEEEKLLDNFRDGKVKTKEFKVGDLFDASTGDVDLQQKDVNGKGTYFINSGLTERGIKGKTDRLAKIFPANTITIDFWGNAFYRDFDYKMATHNHVFSLSGDCIKNKRVGLFLSSALSKFTNVFSYSNMGTWTKIKEMTISLPVTPSCDPDYDLMDRYIHAIEKTVIRDVVNWKSKELKAKNAASDS
ncbi:MAG: restriction endonuclease subunit S [Eubacterium sp.]